MPEVKDTPDVTDQNSPKQVEGVSRREFLANTILAGALLATGVSAANAVVRYLIPPKQSIGGTSEMVEVVAVAELPEGSAISFAYNGIPCAVINVGGDIRGFSRVCPHLQCAIDWDEGSGTFICPCHAAVFDNNGKVVSGPSPKPIPQLKIDVKDGKVLVGGWA